MRLKIIEHNTLETLRDEASKSRDRRYQARLEVIILAMRGVPSKLIQKEVPISPKTYYFWVHSYNDGGMQALKEIKTTGRSEGNPKYDAVIFLELFERLDVMREQWSVVKMQKFVKKLHAVDVPYETMRMRVKRAGYAYRSKRVSSI